MSGFCPTSMQVYTIHILQAAWTVTSYSNIFRIYVYSVAIFLCVCLRVCVLLFCWFSKTGLSRYIRINSVHAFITSFVWSLDDNLLVFWTFRNQTCCFRWDLSHYVAADSNVEILWPIPCHSDDWFPHWFEVVFTGLALRLQEAGGEHVTCAVCVFGFRGDVQHYGEVYSAVESLWHAAPHQRHWQCESLRDDLAFQLQEFAGELLSLGGWELSSGCRVCFHTEKDCFKRWGVRGEEKTLNCYHCTEFGGGGGVGGWGGCKCTELCIF